MIRPAPLDTARLRLEPWSEAHSELLVRLSAMPEVTRYIGAGEPWERTRAEAVAAAQVDHWRRHGFGWRVAVERATGGEVGFIALNFTGPGTEGLAAGEYEIGWWLDPSVQGRGFAREGGAAVRDEALGSLGAPSVLARLQPENRASRRVAEALGLRFDFETTGEAGEPVMVYRLVATLPGRRFPDRLGIVTIQGLGEFPVSWTGFSASPSHAAHNGGPSVTAGSRASRPRNSYGAIGCRRG